MSREVLPKFSIFEDIIIQPDKKRSKQHYVEPPPAILLLVDISKNSHQTCDNQKVILNNNSRNRLVQSTIMLSYKIFILKYNYEKTY